MDINTHWCLQVLRVPDLVSEETCADQQMIQDRCSMRLRYVRSHGFLKYMTKRRILVGEDKKPVDQASGLRLAEERLSCEE